MDNDELLDTKAVCLLIGGSRPINQATHSWRSSRADKRLRRIVDLAGAV